MAPMIKLLIQFDTDPYEQMRYPTVGDWFWTTDTMLRVTSAKLSDPRYELLIQYHEMTEALILREQGVAEADVTAFDIAYEECRRLKLPAPCRCRIAPEPGEDIHAPYHYAHAIATKCEYLLAEAIGVDWADYEEEVDKLA